MLEVWTARIDCDDPDRVDITRKGADTVKRKGRVTLASAFAPSWRILNEARKALERAERLKRKGQQQRGDTLKKEAWGWYKERYTDEMALSYHNRRAAWDDLLARPRVVLVCYCLEHRQCHRWLLGNMLKELGAEYRGEVDREPLLAHARRVG
jgi:hypothetical protein